jgi:hypothetical protein
MATDERLSDRERDLRQLLAARAIAEGRKRYLLTIGELGPLSEARKDDDIRASLFFYRQLVTRL